MNKTPDWSDKTILVVEDEPVNQYFFKTVLETSRISILFTASGQESIELVLEHPEIDCVLMDIRLPGIDGFEATRQIKKIRPELVVIVQTAYALSNDRLKAFEAGCDVYLTKPLQVAQLFEVLQNYLH
ncbi:response regulator [Roseimarinus sediminis]|jgi:hypothetical protein|uniref:response regulator n=1 Tax=Roseimarinus sediminis TaxID=1610899 RepID=UPI003D1B9A24